MVLNSSRWSMKCDRAMTLTIISGTIDSSA